MKLKDRNGNLLKFIKINKIERKIETLKILTKDNPTKEIADKIKSLLASETFASLFVEGEISSRRNIRKSFNEGEASKIMKGNEAEVINDFINSYTFACRQKEFSISNLFTLYSLVSSHGIAEYNKLKDGHMFRHDKVFISSNKKDGDYEGFPQERVHDSLNDLFDYLNNGEGDLYLKAMVGHIYFEMIHPYFDFNGRTGRFIPMWLFTNNGKLNEMMYFATAVGNYRKQYLALFNKYIDHRTYHVDIDKIVAGMLDLLILNQRQYIWIKDLENQYINKTNKSFSSLQKDFIWTLMIKSEISNSEGSWFKLTKKDKDFIETELKAPLFSKETLKLKEANIIGISDDKPRKYSLKGYKLFGISHKM